MDTKKLSFAVAI